MVLRKCSRRSRHYPQLGDYFLLQVADRFLVGSHGIEPAMPPGSRLCYLSAVHQDLEQLARDRGVIKHGQTIAD
jgi:hypothetical protein